VAVFENRQPVTAAKFINKSSLFIQLLGVIRRLELKPNSEQKAEHIIRRPAILPNRLLYAVLPKSWYWKSITNKILFSIYLKRLLFFSLL